MSVVMTPQMLSSAFGALAHVADLIDATTARLPAASPAGDGQLGSVRPGVRRSHAAKA
jgi:hypothetical protein